MALRERGAQRYDVVVAGGGSAGVAAAAGAAAAGARVLLVESCGFLGGAATRAMVLAYCGLYPQRPPPRPPRIVEGVAARVIAELAALGLDVEPYYSASGNWNVRLNPEATKIALDRIAAGAGVEVRLHTHVVGADLREGRIEAVRIADHGGVHDVRASTFVDASGEADLAFLAGASACPLHAAGVRQPASYPVRIGGIAPGQKLDKAERAAALAEIERRIGRAELRADGGIMTALPGTDDVWWLAVEVVCDALDGGDLAIAERDGRALVWRGVEALRRHVPGFARACVAATGPAIGIRESRHIATVSAVHEADVAGGRVGEDGVALGGWPMEIHSGSGRTEYRPVGGGGGVFSIPLDALRAGDIANLWLGGRTIGADPAAFASVRVMGTSFATGQAAGVAAALQAGVEREPPAAGDVRRELLRQGAVLAI